jgi:hypothetical protein
VPKDITLRFQQMLLNGNDATASEELLFATVEAFNSRKFFDLATQNIVSSG